MKNDFVSSGRAVSDMKAHLVLTTKVSQFSKGMQMRLNFARALLNCPELIHFSEAPCS